MSVIFFDGFNHELDPHYWETVGATVDVGQTFPWVPSYLEIAPSATLENRARLSGIGLQIDKTLYLGMRISNYAINVAAESESGAGQPFLKFLDVFNEPLFEIRWRGVYSSPDICLSLFVNNVETARWRISTSTFAEGEIIRPAAYLEDNTYRYLFAPDQFVGDPPTFDVCSSTQMRTLEFEINTSLGTVAIKFEGGDLINEMQNIIPPTLGVFEFEGWLAGIQIHGSPVCNSRIHDIYLIDNVGTGVTTWLGSDFKIGALQFTVEPAVLDAWAEIMTGENIMPPGAYHVGVNDGDTAYIATTAENNSQAYPGDFIVPEFFNPTMAVAAGRFSSISKQTGGLFYYKYINHNTVNNVTSEIGTRVSLRVNAGPTQYSIKRAQFIEQNPETNAPWILTDIMNNIVFGVKSTSPP